MTETEIGLTVEASGWTRAVPGLQAVCTRAVRATLDAAYDGPGPVEVSLLLTGDEAVHALNREYRGKDKPTNVLSFPGETEAAAPGAPVLLGDVVLAYETCAREAALEDKSLAHHMTHLIVHGVLHLLGFDHEAVAEARTMEAREVAILEELGIADPYRVPHND